MIVDESGFRHVFQGAPTPDEGRALLLLHGTGGDERSLLPLASALPWQGPILSVRGRSMEEGVPRFFRRLAEGVFDPEDIRERAAELAAFLAFAAGKYAFDKKRVVALGYSNGANMAGALMLLHPEALHFAALIRPMTAIEPEPLPDLSGKRALILAGAWDEVTPPEFARQLSETLASAGCAVEFEEMQAGHAIVPADIERVRRRLDSAS